MPTEGCFVGSLVKQPQSDVKEGSSIPEVSSPAVPTCKLKCEMLLMLHRVYPEILRNIQGETQKF